MTCQTRVDAFETAQDDYSARSGADATILRELIEVLAPHAGGLRRWSVMNAIRKNRSNAARDIPQKLEDHVERAFRRFCAPDTSTAPDDAPSKGALFFRPREKAGEVWAVFPDRAKAWLDGEMGGL